jgi:serine/threonine protein kinase
MDCQCGFCLRFELREDFVEGGLSKVYKAHDKETDRFVAIKFLEQSENPLLVKSMWEIECRALKRFRTSYVAGYVSSGNAKCKKSLFIATEWLEDNLQSRLDRGLRPGNLKQWLSLAGGISEGLVVSHNQGIFHRDLKPGNLMFRSANDDDWRPVFIDFGAASTEEQTGLETVGQFHTPLYAPANYHLASGLERDLFAAAAVLVVVLQPDQPRSQPQLLDQFQKLRSSDLYGGHFFRVLDKALRPSSQNLFLSAEQFRDSLLEAKREKYNSNVPSEALHFALTKAAQMAVERLNSTTDTSPIKFISSHFDGPFWIRFSEESLQSRNLSSFNVFAGQLELSCAADRKSGPDAPFAVLGVKMHGESRFEESIESLDELSRFFDPVVHSTLRGVKSQNTRRALDTLKQVLTRQATVTANSDKEAAISASLEHSKRMLEARKRASMAGIPSLEFETIDSDGEFVLVRAETSSELPSGATWQLEGSENPKNFLTLTSVKDDSLGLRSNRPFANFPSKGRLVPHLGLNETAFSRQELALTAISSGDSIFPAFSTLLAKPQLVERPKQILHNDTSDLDAPKNEALKGALGAPEIFVVEGPPGTGKTKFITALLEAHLSRHPTDRVLVVSQTNVAVDNVLERLPESLARSAVRVTREDPSAVSEGGEPFIIDNQLKAWREQVSVKTGRYLDELLQGKPEIAEKVKLFDLFQKLVNLLIQAERFAEEELARRTSASLEILEVDLEALPGNQRWIGKGVEGVREKLKTLPVDGRLLSTTSSNFVQSAVDQLLASSPALEEFRDLLALHSSWNSRFGYDQKLRSILIERASIVAGTCIGFVRDGDVRKLDFDLCIVDESSRATSNELLVPISRSRKVVLIGDTRQLPPNDEDILSQPDILNSLELTPEDFRKTIFSDLVDKLPDENKALLSIQYRMAPEIGNLISHCFYDGNLQTEYLEEGDIIRKSLLPKVLWIDTSMDAEMEGEERTRSGSKKNTLEIEVTGRYLSAIASKIDAVKGQLKEPVQVLLIAPYKAQVNLMRRFQSEDFGPWMKVRVETLDAVQGVEADITLLSVTRSNKRGDLGFIGPSYWRRVNVALSRARHKLVIVGDISTIKRSKSNLSTPGLHSVVAYLEGNPQSCSISAARIRQGG